MEREQAPDDRINADEIRDIALNCILPIAESAGVKHYRRVLRLIAVANDIVDWRREHNAPESDCARYIVAVKSVVSLVCSGQNATDYAAAMRAELDADTAEDHIDGLVAIEGPSPELLERRAAARERQAATSLVAARADRNLAREIRNARGPARERFNLPRAG